MIKTKRENKRYLGYIILLGLLSIMFLFHRYIFLYADDFYYSRDAVSAMNNIPQYALKELKSNGRVWIHLLLQLQLIDKIKYFRLVNPFAITFGAYLIARVSLGEKIKGNNKFIGATLITSLFFLIIPVQISEDSIYYAACSLNYLYPSCVVLLYGYLMIKEYERMENDYKVNFFVVILALLSGASSQQAGMIAIGFTIMTTIYFILFRNKKINKKVIWYYLCVFLGYATIIFGSILRMKADKNTGTKIVVVETISQILQTSIFSKPMSLFIITTMICATFIVLKYLYKGKKKECNKNKIYCLSISIISIISLVGYMFLIFIRGINIEVLYGNIFKVVFVVCFSIWFVMITLYATYLIMINEKNPLYLLCMVNAIGAQLMLIVVDSRYAETYRVIFPSLMLIMVFITYSILELYKNPLFNVFITGGIFVSLVFLNGWIYNIITIIGILIISSFIITLFKPRFNKAINLLLCIICIVLAFSNMHKVYYGYKQSAYYLNYNINAIENYKSNGATGTLVLKYVPVTIYGHSLGRWNEMPYYMKQCYGLREDTIVEYIE